jgi:hypothetical protein
VFEGADGTGMEADDVGLAGAPYCAATKAGRTNTRDIEKSMMSLTRRWWRRSRGGKCVETFPPRRGHYIGRTASRSHIIAIWAPLVSYTLKYLIRSGNAYKGSRLGPAHNQFN